MLQTELILQSGYYNAAISMPLSLKAASKSIYHNDNSTILYVIKRFLKLIDNADLTPGKIYVPSIRLKNIVVFKFNSITFHNRQQFIDAFVSEVKLYSDYYSKLLYNRLFLLWNKPLEPYSELKYNKYTATRFWGKVDVDPMALVRPNTILLELYITAYGVLKHQEMADDLLKLLSPYVPSKKPFLINYATWLGSNIEQLSLGAIREWTADKAAKSSHLLKQLFE